MREIAYVSDGAIDHIEAFLAILLSLSLTQGPGGGEGFFSPKMP